MYDVADYHTEAARLARMPGIVRELVRRRERTWARDAAGTLAVSEPVADLVQQRWGIARPVILMNCPPAWRPEEPGPIESDLVAGRRGHRAPTGRSCCTRAATASTGASRSWSAAMAEPPMRELDAVCVFMGFGRLEGWLREQAAA